MTLRETDRIDIDAAPLDNRPGGVDLYIVDPGTIPDPAERMALLAQKLRTYVGYVYGPEFALAHPEGSPGSVVIWVLCQDAPTDDMLRIQRIGPVDGEARAKIPVVFADLDHVIARLQERAASRRAAESN